MLPLPNRNPGSLCYRIWGHQADKVGYYKFWFALDRPYDAKRPQK